MLYRPPNSSGRALIGAAVAAAALALGWTADARRRARESGRIHRALVDLLLNAMSAGDPVTERHSRRVADLTDALADRHDFRGERRARLRIASLLHDMGKLDDRFFKIVHSCEPLTPEQRHEIEKHPHESADILQPLERIHPGITPIVESHHECWDGTGYPGHLHGEQIPLEARLISVADVFDAMTQPRAYHDPMEVDDALERIRDAAGTRFDPAVVAELDDPALRTRWSRLAAEGREREVAKLKG